MSEHDIHELYAVRYGHHDRQARENFIGDAHDLLQPLDFYVWVIRGPQGTIVVDTGFDQLMARKRQRTVLKPVAEALKALEVDAAAVEHVIISHLHYDHSGNYDLFPRACYHLQDVEMAYATGRMMCHPHLRLPFELDDVLAMVRKVFAGRVAFVDGAAEIVPGVSVHQIGGHSKGLQCVQVKTRRGLVVLASDSSHLYAHFEGGRVFPIVYNVGDVLEGYARLKRLASSPHHIIPGHDPLVLARYPAPKSGLENWVVRLDVDPVTTAPG